MNLNNASGRKAIEFREWLFNCFLDEQAPSYATHDEMRRAWLQKWEYTDSRKQWLISKARFFIRMLDTKSPDSRNMSFLKALAKDMADYLSQYTMREYGTSDDQPTRRQYRKQAKAELMDALFNKFSYIQHLRMTQNYNCATRQTRKKIAHQQSVKISHKIADEVRAMFFDAAFPNGPRR